MLCTLDFVEKLLIVKSHISDRSSSDNVFISGGNHHLIRRFCGVVLGPTMISKMVSESGSRFIGSSGFCYRATHHLCLRTKPNGLTM
ncbi:hypothetical protein MTR_3g449780 [Medicago truncatula]|uniref:Uncharacterized protein n=1 Tax=Medicago truncatula TaxID=3880 RepID=A0A072UVI1_MEDTR|nr:hypothetical protein MTR_3g449780 [Medicago truncatula]